jgi:hypothetical protein
MRWAISNLRSALGRALWLAALFVLVCHLSLLTASAQKNPFRFNLGGDNDLKMISTPSTNPDSAHLRVYAKTTGAWCFSNNLGTEVCVPLLLSDDLTTLTYTGTGGISAASFISTGSGAGYVPMVQGTLKTVVPYSWGWMAPASGLPASGIALIPPVADPAGQVLHCAAPDGNHRSACTWMSSFGSNPAALLVTKAAGPDPTTNNCVKWLAGGGVGDAGAACGAVSPLPIANGGTNAATATAARQNLGVSYSLQAHEIENGNTWVASTTYYLGGRYGKGTVETYTDYFPIVKPGTLLGFCVTTGISGTHSDAATPITFYIRKNKATDSVATVTQTWNAAEVGTTCTTPYPLTANLMTFANGEAITVKVTTPAWSTPPTNVYFSVTIEIQEDQ